MVRRLAALALLAALAPWHGGCGEPASSVVLTFDAERSVVLAELPAEVVAALEARSGEGLPGRLWPSVLRVEVAEEPSQGVAVHGRYALNAGTLEFAPTFPFLPDVPYRARFDGEALSRVPGLGAIGSAELQILEPRAERAAPPRVVAVHPSGDVLPENLLRMYLHFSEPMRQGVAWEHLRLEDERGEAIELGLLELDHELWDPSGTRLTLLFDPGRLKTGLRPNREEGRPLDGRPSVALVVSGAWPSAHGVPLGSDHRRRYSVGPPDHSQPRPGAWTLSLPAAGSRAPLVLALDGALDHGMLQGALRVERRGEVVGTSATAGPAEATVELTPVLPWSPGTYRLLVDPRLEDPSGNSVRRPFETRVGEVSREEPAAALTFELVHSSRAPAGLPQPGPSRDGRSHS